MKNKKIISLTVAFIISLAAMPLMAQQEQQGREQGKIEPSYGLIIPLNKKYPDISDSDIATAFARSTAIILGRNIKNYNSPIYYDKIRETVKINTSDVMQSVLVEVSTKRNEEMFEIAYKRLLTLPQKRSIVINALEELINMPDGADGFNYLFYNIEKRGDIKISSQERAKFLEEAIILHTSDLDLFVQIFDFLTPQDITEYFEASRLLEYSKKEDMGFYTTNLVNLLDGNVDNLKATVKQQRVPLIAHWAYFYSQLDEPAYLDYVQLLIDFGANLDTEVENGKTVRDYINESPIEAVRNLIK